MTTQTNQNEQATKSNSLSAKQKMILALCSMAAVVVIVVTSVLGTVAYLTSSAAVSNVFTIGNVSMTLTESKVNPNGTLYDAGATQVDTNTYHLVPDTTYVKDPKITITAGSENSFLFVLVRNDLEGIAANTAEHPSIAVQLARNGWAKYTKASTGWVYVYVGHNNGVSNVPDEDAALSAVTSFNYAAEAVQPGEYYLFKEFTIGHNANVSNYGAAKITITAVAIQNSGFNSIDEAWEAVQKTYPYIYTGSAN